MPEATAPDDEPPKQPRPSWWRRWFDANPDAKPCGKHTSHYQGRHRKPNKPKPDERTT